MSERRDHLPSIDKINPTKLQISTYGFIRELFGAKYARVLLGADPIPMELQNPLRDHFYGVVKERFGAKEPGEFYIGQLKHANRFIEGFVQIVLPDREDEIVLLDEAALLTEDPLVGFNLLTRPDVAPRAKFEIGRQLYLAYLFGGINARNRDHRVHSDLNDFHAMFSHELFEGQIGQVYPITMRAIYDNETNRCVRVGADEHMPEITDTQHTKAHNFNARFVEGIGYVLINPRKKDDSSAMAKALAKSLGDDKADIDVSREDTVGELFVVFGDDSDVQKLIPRVIDLVGERSDILRIEDDDEVQTNRGQSEDIHFRRKKVWLEGQDLPFELMFFTLKDYLNYRYEVGVRDAETGQYSGQAHDLFELRRLSKLVPFLFPDGIYARGDGDRLDTSVIDRFERVASGLKSLR